MAGHAIRRLLPFFLSAALVAAAAAVVLGGSSARAGDTGTVLRPPPGAQAYHAAFPDFGGPEDRVSAERIDAFERAAGRQIAWAYFSNNWFHGRIRFPAEDVETIAEAGRVPFIRLMARSGFGRGRDRNFSMRSIAEGEWDSDLEEWCQDAAGAGVPLLAEFGTEVNGEWFPWNGRWNGAGHDANHDGEPDGPEHFIAAYRRIVETCHGEGADDITWFFHVDVGSQPRAKWNQPWDYYPGDDVVDWVGLSDYGPLKPSEPWESFRERMDAVIYKLLDQIGDDKPLAVLEYGAAGGNRADERRKARWISRAAGLVAQGHWPEIHALAYWHEQWENGDGSRSDLHIDSSARARRAYREALGGDEFTSEPVFGAR